MSSEVIEKPGFDTSNLTRGAITSMLGNALGVARELSHAEASAQIDAEWEALDPSRGYMDGNERGVSPVAAGWNVGVKPPAPKPAEIEADDDPFSLDTELERRQSLGWNINPR